MSQKIARERSRKIRGIYPGAGIYPRTFNEREKPASREELAVELV